MPANFRSAQGVRFSIELPGERGSDEFKAARRDIRKTLNDALVSAGQKIVLPSAKRNAASLRIDGTPVASYLTIKARSGNRVSLTLTTQRRKVAKPIGWLEFGGVNKGALVPKRAKAILTPWGPRAYARRGTGGVGQPARIDGMLFMGKAATSRVNRWRTEREITRQLNRVMRDIGATPR